nr:LysR family transcriptional regulator [Pectobacterium colocasium]
MSLKALRTLVAIAQYGSFARAAEAVCLTQSAVSLHVRSLEEDFKVSLFESFTSRSGTHGSRTSCGRAGAGYSCAVRRHCRRIR